MGMDPDDVAMTFLIIGSKFTVENREKIRERYGRKGNFKAREFNALMRRLPRDLPSCGGTAPRPAAGRELSVGAGEGNAGQRAGP